MREIEKMYQKISEIGKRLDCARNEQSMSPREYCKKSRQELEYLLSEFKKIEIPDEMNPDAKQVKEIYKILIRALRYGEQGRFARMQRLIRGISE